MPKPREWWINSYRPPGKPVEGYHEVWHDSLKEAEECEDDDKEERKDRLNERIHVREVREGEEELLTEKDAAIERLSKEVAELKEQVEVWKHASDMYHRGLIKAWTLIESLKDAKGKP